LGSVSIDGVSEYYFFRIGFSNAKTTGAGGCSGCADGACLVLSEVHLSQTVNPADVIIINALSRNYVTWQSTGANVPGGCPSTTPARNTTWGGIKSLYR
jgi:hypothetical protein